jgi:hypothetical protein
VATVDGQPVVGRPRFGPLVGAGLVVLYAVLWVVYRPVQGIDLSYVGEILGVEAVVFMAVWSMAMVTVLPGMESAYAGWTASWRGTVTRRSSARS